MKCQTFVGAAVAAWLATAAGMAAAQGFPARPVTMVVPYAPGGTGDILGRLLAREMGKALGQSVTVENRGGAGGNIGADLVARSSKPDGHTVLFTATSLASNVSLMKNLSFDPRKDLVAVAGPITLQNVVVVTAGSPIKDLPALVAKAKAEPGKLNYGSSGYGTSNHLATALFELSAGVEMTHVPFKSAGQALPALIGGHVDLMIDLMPSALSQISTGKLRALAVTGSKRSASLPDVPTVAEAGVPGYSFSAWFGLFAPGGTPPAIVRKLNGAVAKAMQSDEFKARLVQVGAEGEAGTPASFDTYFRGEVDQWARVVKSGRLPPLE